MENLTNGQNEEHAKNSMEDVFGEVISRYTRANALEDGVLVDVSEEARKAGFSVPVAMTASVWAEIETINKNSCQDVMGRLWDVLNMARFQIKVSRSNCGDRVLFQVIMSVKGTRKRKQTYAIHSGPGDNREHVLTIMQINED